MPKIKYKYDAGLSASFDNLNENDDFEQDCSMEGFFISYLQMSKEDMRIWFKPKKWLKKYYGFSKKQLKGVLLLSRLGWTNDSISVLEIMKDYKLDSLTKKQLRFLSKSLDGSNDFQEGIDIEKPFKKGA